jgi:hypothetical protein
MTMQTDRQTGPEEKEKRLDKDVVYGETVFFFFSGGGGDALL